MQLKFTLNIHTKLLAILSVINLAIFFYIAFYTDIISSWDNREKPSTFNLVGLPIFILAPFLYSLFFSLDNFTTNTDKMNSFRKMINSPLSIKVIYLAFLYSIHAMFLIIFCSQYSKYT